MREFRLHACNKASGKGGGGEECATREAKHCLDTPNSTHDRYMDLRHEASINGLKNAWVGLAGKECDALVPPCLCQLAPKHRVDSQPVSQPGV